MRAQALAADPVNHRREMCLLTLDGQQEADLPAKREKSAAFPLEERLGLSLGLTPKATLGELVGDSLGAQRGLAGRELVQQGSASTHYVCRHTSHSAKQVTYTSRTKSLGTVVPTAYRPLGWKVDTPLGRKLGRSSSRGGRLC